MDWLYDSRTECFSVQTTMLVSEYLDLVREAHAAKGGLSGQRDTLKTTTGKRIRDRMVNDIRYGAVLPPVVIGAVVTADAFALYPKNEAKSISDVLPKEAFSDISIIDGMQRTTAIMEAATVDSTVLARNMRVEFWITQSVRAMVYRMLVLNTGQVPWTLPRQLSVVFEPLLKEIQSKVTGITRMFTPDKTGRRVTSGEYSSDALVELYIAFSLRKTNVDTKEALSDEFSRLDFVENVSDTRFQGQFYEILSILTKLDASFSKHESAGGGKFSKGKNIFDGQPARVGFIVAVAQYLLGRPGMDRVSEERSARLESLVKDVQKFIDKLDGLSHGQLGEFLKLDVLSETLTRRGGGQVGRVERSFYFEAFQVLINERFNVPSMEPCWRAS